MDRIMNEKEKEVILKIVEISRKRLEKIKKKFPQGYPKYSPMGGKFHSEKTKKLISKRRLERKEKLGYLNSPEARKKMKEARAKQIIPFKDTKIEIKIQRFLKKLNINFMTHQYIKKIKHGYQCDIFIPEMNLIIECDGNYWHKYPHGKEIDHIRTKELIEKGFRVIRLWECEIKNMYLDDFKKMLDKI